MASSTFVNVPGLVILRSEDLVNWEIAGHCISSFTGDSKYNMEGGTKYGNGCFAPSIAYKNGTFYVAVTPNGERTRIYYAKDVAGPWNYNTLGVVTLILACLLMMMAQHTWRMAELGKTR